jgi:hypothetical protein
MNLASKWLSAPMCLAILLSSPVGSWAQSTPLPTQDVSAIYKRLLPQIEKIPIVDMHAHPGYWDDSDVDAMAVTVTDLDPFRTRATNPEWTAAAKALFGYPFSDFSPEHADWLDKKDDELRKQWGKDYFTKILDMVGIQVGVANRVAMDYLEGNPRFRWVVFVDTFMFPFNNHDLAIDPDRAVYFPMQEKVLHRYMAQAGASHLPADLAGYEALIKRVLDQDTQQGAVAVKFESPYFRSLVNISDPPREQAEAVYRKYSAGGVPSAEEYLLFQDYIFRCLIVQAGSRHLEVHVHSAVGSGSYYHLRAGNAMDLENILRDPRYKDTIFVMLHGGYPYDRESIWLAALPNVYLDSSEFVLLTYPAEYSRILKNWFEIFPEKVVFGSDAFPYTREIAVPETYWLAVYTARTATAAALAEMVADGEISEAKAMEIAGDYFHDTTAKLLGLPTLAQSGK